ncbi:MAG: carboxypeptidase regulatory-like domain-containing protein [Chthonomonas sp.]|nr:carboxypeptidase regulatory-like domain-containing protein [Chthonomonas sp.]
MNLLRSGGAAALAVLVCLAAVFLAYGVTTEVPIGSVTGQVIMTENGRPLPEAAIIIRPKTNDDLQTARVRFFRADKNGKFSLRGIPAGLYEVEISANAHELKKTARSLLVEEGKSKDIRFELDPLPEYLTLYANQHVFMPEEEPNVQIHGFVRSNKLDVRVYKVPNEDIIRERDFYRVLSPMSQSREKLNSHVVFEKSWDVEADDAEGTFQHTMDFGKLDPGIYFVQFSAPPFQNQKAPEFRGTYLLVTDLALVAKRAKDKIHVFATNLKTGEPVIGVPVQLAHGDSIRNLGVTSSDGTLQAPLASNEAGGTSVPSAIVGRRGESTAIVTFNDYSGSPLGMRFFIQTDRPIYRPGDKVQFRAAARRPDGAGYALPTATTASYEIEDSNGKTLKKSDANVTSFGTFSGDFLLPEGSTEAVTLNVTIDGKSETKTISVEAYRKPEFKITATPVKEFYLRGDKAQMKVKCEYYFGGPVVGAELTASVGKTPLWSWVDPETGEEESYGGDWSEYVADAEAVTDNNGEAILTIDTKEITWGQWDTVDQELIFDISGSEGDDRWFDGRGRVKLLQGDISIISEQDRWVVGPGEETEFTFELVTPDAGSEAIKNREITVETGYEVWDENRSTYTPEGKTTVTTDAEGKARIKVTPKNPGDFRVRASTRDRRGSIVQASGWVTVYRDGYAFSGPAPALQVMLDKRSYEPGDTINALVRSGAKTGSVWVTLETDDILAEKVVPLKGGVGKVSFLVTENLKPNAFVSLSLINEKQLSTAQRRVTVKLTSEILNVSVKSDKAVYKPGDTARYTISTKNNVGAPVQAEVALGVVDEAIYAIMEDEDNPVDSFYPTRYSMINTYNSFPELYLDGGDKGDGEQDIRKVFEDTALWAPRVVTNAEGKATIEVKLPDNLTSWRATATALTADTKVGKATSNMIAKKDLMVRLATPMFLTQFDKLALTATVNNTTKEPIQAEVSLRANGVSITDAVKKQVRIEAEQSAQVVWQIEMPNSGSAQFEVVATGGALRDGMRVEVPIKVHGKLQVEGGALELSAAKSEFEVNLDPSSKSGELKISVAPNLLVAVIPSLEQLVDYPYGCAEQTMSRFVPAVVARQAMRSMGVSKPELEAKIDKVTALSLQRLRELQTSQGGWGWFEHDEPMPWTTATVLDGLYRAKQAGVQVDEAMVARGIEWAHKYLPTEDARVQNNDRVPLAAALLKWNPSDALAKQHVGAIYKDGTLPLVAICHELISKHWGDMTSLRDVRLQTLWSKANVRQDTITWDDSWGARTTALALEALMSASPEDPRIPKVARGLFMLSKGNRWQSTMDTALSVQALIPYVQSRGAGPSLVSVQVNESDLVMTGSTYKEATVPASELKSGSNKVSIWKTGEGTGFASWTMTQTPMKPTFAAEPSGGIQIKRTFHTLGATRLEDGSMSLQPSKNAVTSVPSGEAFRCKVEINAKQPMSYAMIEIPLPSNAKVSVRDDFYDWSFWYSGMSVLDDKITYFATHVPAGLSVIEFNLRAEAVGTSSILPAQVIEMYAPDRQAASESMKLEVRR